MVRARIPLVSLAASSRRAMVAVAQRWASRRRASCPLACRRCRAGCRGCGFAWGPSLVLGDAGRPAVDSFIRVKPGVKVLAIEAGARRSAPRLRAQLEVEAAAIHAEAGMGRGLADDPRGYGGLGRAGSSTSVSKTLGRASSSSAAFLGGSRKLGKNRATLAARHCAPPCAGATVILFRFPRARWHSAGYEPRGRRFESCQPRYISRSPTTAWST